MNIKDAKEQIKNAMVAYFTKDEYGDYVVPVERQRPVFLMGPPGIGKTAIMEQVAAEMGVGLLTYSMTHHTRQSALGLPYIAHRNYKGMEYEISEYTMSEIIASIYDLMEETGVEEGILFLDEINCVSETLAPVMLQFLQYKVFGKHQVPEGWIIVTAGNPPEYNHSVREFDIVTWDRLKRIDVEPDYDAWKEYAYQQEVHPAILTYLDIKKTDFYKVESTIDGKTFVTARGWDDLSQMLRLYEQHEMKVDEKLIGQYLQNPKIAKEFAAYYDLFQKYRGEYQVEQILDGTESEEIRSRAKNARFDERLSLIGLLLDRIGSEVKDVLGKEQVVAELMATLKEYQRRLSTGEERLNRSETGADSAVDSAAVLPMTLLGVMAEEKIRQLEAGKKSGSSTRDEQSCRKKVIASMQRMMTLIQEERDADQAFAIVKADFAKMAADLKASATEAGRKLSNLFLFCEKVYADGQEMLVLVTELTSNAYCAKYISRYGCEEYFKHNKELLFYERQQEIDAALEEL